MKKHLLALFAILCIAISSLFAQAPQKMSYQAVVRNAENVLVTEHAVGVQVSVLQGGPSGAAVYVETHNVTTNANGLMTLEVGGGNAQFGTFAEIPWGVGPFYLKTEIDPNGGTAYTIEGVQQLLSVPYALHAGSVDLAMLDSLLQYVDVARLVNLLTSDTTYASALQGPVGPQGPQGEQGLQGAAGPAGPQGPQGEQGATGAQGPAGPQGPQGEQGLQGATGPAGPQGPQGEQGLQGAAGPAGPQGPQGEQGATGAQGPAGPQGEQGATGAQGEQGEQGPAGPQGPQGEQGATGPQGPQGEQGATGAQGPAGTNGQDGFSPIVNTTSAADSTIVMITDANGQHSFVVYNGEQGLPGATGAQGPQGPAGATGAQGEQGPAGPQGPQGPAGATGAQGPQGPQGEQGPAGAQGPQGERGEQGASGVQGQDGFSPIVNTTSVGDSTVVTITDASGDHSFVLHNGVDGTMTFEDLTPSQRESLRGAQGEQGPAGVQGPQGEAGQDGANGQDGFSPIVTTSSAGDSTTVTITDATSTRSFVLRNGERGEQGPAGETPIIKPIVTTEGYEISNDTVILKGRVLYAGNDSSLYLGIYCSTNPSAFNLEHSIHTTLAALQSNDIEITITGLQPNTTYYYCAYGVNSDGMNRGEMKSFTTPSASVGPCPEAHTVTDIDGNTYSTVKIGEQCWMAEDLRTTHYANGAEIGQYVAQQIDPNSRPLYVTDVYSFSTTASTGNFNQFSNNNNWNMPTPKVCYNLEAIVNGSHNHGTGTLRGLCPEGWHTPTTAEWQTMLNEFDDGNRDPIVYIGTSESGFNGSYSSYYIPNDRWDDLFFCSYTSSQLDFGSNGMEGIWCLNNSYFPSFAYFMSVRCLRGEGATALPKVEMVSIDNITANSAFVAAQSLSDGGSNITEQGICWNTTGNPTISDANQHDTVTHVCSFMNLMSSLTPQTTYYVRAYATNANGTVYSDSTFTFTTTTTMNQPCPDAPTVTDIDGNTYETVQIGEQCWMKEDLKTLHYITGARVSSYTKSEEWPRVVWARNYVLYSQQAAINNSTQGICPEGWRMPSSNDYGTLFTMLGGMENAFPKIISQSGWSVNNATNESGFSLNYVPIYNYFPEIGLERFDVVVLLTDDFSQSYMLSSEGITHTGGLSGMGTVRCIKGAGTTGMPQVKIDSLQTEGQSAYVYVSVLSDGSAIDTTYGVQFRAIDSTNNEELTWMVSSTEQLIRTHICAIEDLSPNTTYVVRAFATNANGTAYSDSLYTFTTSPIAAPTYCPEQQYVTDMDGNVYNTVKIGNQCWMKENLRTTVYADGTSLYPYGTPYQYQSLYKNPTQVYGYTAARYGLLYSLDAITRNAPQSYTQPIQGICPDGWHVPTADEFEILLDYASNYDDAAAALTENSAFWTDGYPHTNESGFSARPSGFMYESDTTSMWYLGMQFDLPTSTFDDDWTTSAGGMRTLHGESGDVWMSNVTWGKYLPVRCIRGEGTNAFPPVLQAFVENITDSTAEVKPIMEPNGHEFDWDSFRVMFGTSQDSMQLLSFDSPYVQGMQGPYVWLRNLAPQTTYYLQICATYDGTETLCSDINVFSTPTATETFTCGISTVTDVDGNSYNTVQIGNYCWTKENLKTTLYPDGTPIYHATSVDPQSDACWVYPNNNAQFKDTYGLLYNWYAAVNGDVASDGTTGNVQGICPTGWHIPSNVEFAQLKSYAGANFPCNGMYNNVAKALASTSLWQIADPAEPEACEPGNMPEANNASQFSAVPAGMFTSNGEEFLTYRAYFLSSTPSTSGTHSIWFCLRDSIMDSIGQYKSYAASVRCVKD